MGMSLKQIRYLYAIGVFKGEFKERGPTSTTSKMGSLRQKVKKSPDSAKNMTRRLSKDVRQKLDELEADDQNSRFLSTFQTREKFFANKSQGNQTYGEKKGSPGFKTHVEKISELIETYHAEMLSNREYNKKKAEREAAKKLIIDKENSEAEKKRSERKKLPEDDGIADIQNDREGEAFADKYLHRFQDLNPEDQQAFVEYAAESYRPINESLRKGRPKHDFVDALDRGIKYGMGMKKGVKVYRAVTEDFAQTLFKDIKDPQDLVGTVITDKGFMSTSMTKGHVDQFRQYAGGASSLEASRVLERQGTLPNKAGGITFQIDLVRGQKGISLWADESEILLPRNTSLEVLEVRGTRTSGLEVRTRVVPTPVKTKKSRK